MENYSPMDRGINRDLRRAKSILREIIYALDEQDKNFGWAFGSDEELYNFLTDWLFYLQDCVDNMNHYIDQYSLGVE